MGKKPVFGILLFVAGFGLLVNFYFGTREAVEEELRAGVPLMQADAFFAAAFWVGALMAAAGFAMVAARACGLAGCLNRRNP